MLNYENRQKLILSQIFLYFVENACFYYLNKVLVVINLFLVFFNLITLKPHSIEIVQIYSYFIKCYF